MHESEILATQTDRTQRIQPSRLSLDTGKQICMKSADSVNKTFLVVDGCTTDPTTCSSFVPPQPSVTTCGGVPQDLPPFGTQRLSSVPQPRYARTEQENMI